MTAHSAEELDAEYNPDGDGEHPIYTRAEWRIDVDQRNTVSGYWQWLADLLEQIEQIDPVAVKKEYALGALRAAVKTQLAHWDAMNALETALGYPGGDVPTDVDEHLVEAVKTFAAGTNDDGSDLEMEHLDMLAKDTRTKWTA